MKLSRQFGVQRNKNDPDQLNASPQRSERDRRKFAARTTTAFGAHLSKLIAAESV